MTVFSLIQAGAAAVKDGMMAHAAFARPRPAPGISRRRPHLVVLMREVDHFDALLRRVAEARDRAAFQELFEHFAPRVKSYAMRLGAPAPAAEDLAQEAMLTMWRKAGLFDPAKASASTWIFTIARNLRIDLIRRERTLRLDGGDPLAEESEPDAGEAFEARENQEALRLALRSLPAEQNQIVMLSFFSDKPHSEIAAELNLPLGTVKSRLRLAMVRLRASLETSVGESP
jgi:RNA polymerase sigma-70 factor (ECF subfamily)